jgi:predicted nuclease with RNAse H fold
MASATVYIGIDPTAGERHMTYAALNARLDILALGSGPFASVVEAVLTYPAAVCAVDAPCQPNAGLLSDPGFREQVGLPVRGSTYTAFRVGEFELRRRGIYLYNTPQEETRLADWVKTGWQLYDRLREAGYADYPAAGARRVFETYPHAVFTVLLGQRPLAKNSLEGRLQRQLLLYDAGLNVPDPMLAMEELTRHRLLTGQLDRLQVYDHDRLDALAAAYTAYCFDREPHRCTAVGHPADGYIIIPTGDLKPSY